MFPFTKKKIFSIWLTLTFSCRATENILGPVQWLNLLWNNHKISINAICLLLLIKCFSLFNLFFSAYFMVPYAMHHQQAYQPQIHMQQHAALPQPTPSIFTYSHGPTSPPHHHHQSYQPVSQLQTSVDYKNVAPLTIVPRKTLPSVTDTNFQQFYSPGLEYHYTESIPTTKLFPHQQVYNYHHHQPAPTASYLQNYVPQMPSYNYYSSAPSAPYVTSYSKPQSTAVLDTYTPSSVTYARPQHQHQQQQYHKNFYQTTPYQQNSHSQLPIPQQLFTPAQQTHYNPQHTPYPSSQAYNTIQYSVPLPPYDHSKRSTSKATANISVNAPKSAWTSCYTIMQFHNFHWIIFIIIIDILICCRMDMLKWNNLLTT